MSVYTLKILMKLANFRRLKSAVGHEHVNVKKLKLINNHLTLIKDKIYLKQDLNWLKTALLGDRRRSDKNDLDDRETVRADQGGSVVPDDETAHKVVRPETHD